MLGQSPEGHEVADVVCLCDVLADVDAPVFARHIGNDGVQALTAGKARIDERRTQVESSPGDLQHVLHEVTDLRISEDGGRQLAHAATRDKHLRRPVDPDLLDLGVIEILLKRPQPRNVRKHGACSVGPVADWRHDPRERLLIPVSEHLIDEVAHHAGVANRVDPAASNLFAHAGLDQNDRVTPHAPNVVGTGNARNPNCG